MVYKRALEAIHEHSEGTARGKALGLYVVLCDLANEQRHVGQHQRIEATYDDLIERLRTPKKRGSIGRSSLRELLTVLDDAAVAHYTVQIDPRIGRIPSVIEIPEQRGRHIQVTIKSIRSLATQPIDLLPALGLIATLLALCDDQGAPQAEASRKHITGQLGWRSPRTLDALVTALESAGLLKVTQQQDERGRSRPRLWDVIEPDESFDTAAATFSEPGTDSGLWGGGGGTVRGSAENDGDAKPGLSSSGTGTVGVRPQEPQGADITSFGPAAARPYARVGDVQEKDKKTPKPPSPSGPEAPVGGEQRTEDLKEQLCEDLLATLQPRNGDGPRRAYEQRRNQWLRAAGEVLSRYSIEQAHVAMAYMLTDYVKGSAGVSMPGFANVVERTAVPRRKPGNACPSRYSAAPGDSVGSRTYQP